MSQVVTRSSEVFPSSRGPTRSVTGTARHWQPRPRQGGTSFLGNGRSGGAGVRMTIRNGGNRGNCPKGTPRANAHTARDHPLPFTSPPLIVKGFTSRATFTLPEAERRDADDFDGSRAGLRSGGLWRRKQNQRSAVDGGRSGHDGNECTRGERPRGSRPRWNRKDSRRQHGPRWVQVQVRS